MLSGEAAPLEPRALERILAWMSEDRLRVEVERAYPLKRAAEAARAREAGGVRGTLAVSPGGCAPGRG